MTQVGVRTWIDVKQPGANPIPEGLWLRCPAQDCGQMIYRKQMEANLHVCPECGHHFRIGADERVRQLCDPDSFEPMFTNLRCADPLEFVDRKPYIARIVDEQKRTGQNEGVKAGRGFIKGRPVALCCLDLTFMMGSMGSVVGEAVNIQTGYLACVSRLLDRRTDLAAPGAILGPMADGSTRVYPFSLSLAR